ncbi:MAG: tetratricopeptide repeat protein, partial [Bacteroidota bacterium]
AAESLLKKTTESMIILLEDRHPYRPICFNNLAGVLRRLNRDNEAIVSYKKAISLWIDIGESADIDRAYALFNVGDILFRWKEYNAAVPTLHQALDLMNRQLSEEHRDTIRVRKLLEEAIANCGE